MNEIKKRYFTVMAAQIERHGGTIEKYIGDAIMAVFGSRRAHEDDALRAVRAAHGMQQELAALNEEFRAFYGVELANRTGVNTGEVVANTDPTPTSSWRPATRSTSPPGWSRHAPANEILIGETTYDLVRDHVEVEAVEPLELKGKSERVPAYRLLRSPRDAGEAVRAGTVRRRRSSVARRRWTILHDAFAEVGRHRPALPARRPSSATPGVGKTRLIRDFIDAALEPSARSSAAGACLRRRHHVLAAGRDRPVGGRRSPRTTPPETARAKCRDAARRRRPERDADRRAHGRAAMGLSAASFPVTELFWGGRALLESLAVDAAAHRRHRRPALGRADVPRVPRAPRRRRSATVAPHRLLRPARALLETHPDWRPTGRRRTDRPRAARRGRRRGDRSTDLLGRAATRRPRRGARSSPRPTATRCSSSSSCRCSSTRACSTRRRLAADESSTCRPADDQRAPRRRASTTCRARSGPSSSRRRSSGWCSSSRRSRRWCPTPSGPTVPTPPDDARSQAVRPPVTPATGRRDLPFPPRPHPRRHLQQPAQAGPGDAPRAVRGVGRAGQPGARPRAGVRGDPRLPPRAGVPLPDRARAARRRRARPRATGRRPSSASAGRRAFARGDMPAACTLLAPAAGAAPGDDPVRIELLTELAEALMEEGEFDEAATSLRGRDRVGGADRRRPAVTGRGSPTRDSELSTSVGAGTADVVARSRAGDPCSRLPATRPGWPAPGGC